MFGTPGQPTASKAKIGRQHMDGVHNSNEKNRATIQNSTTSPTRHLFCGAFIVPTVSYYCFASLRFASQFCSPLPKPVPLVPTYLTACFVPGD